MVPVSESYFDALGTRLTRGRFFAAADGPNAAPVCIVNETLARRIWPGEDPVGQRLKQGFPEGPSEWREVVGVVEDISFEGVTERAGMQIYMPFAQQAPSAFSVLVRTSVPPGSLASAVEAAIASVNRDMPVSAMRTMEDVLGESIARQRMALIVLGIFAAVALTLAAGGLYGLVAHSVTERTHEIGVRMALGAAREDVIRLVITQGLSMAAAGTIIGVAGAAALSGSLQGLVFGVTPLDPATFAAVIVMLFVVALAACYLPAWRATRIQPVTALRVE
jgi:putative ABC transport system permease protein